MYNNNDIFACRQLLQMVGLKNLKPDDLIIVKRKKVQFKNLNDDMVEYFIVKAPKDMPFKYPFWTCCKIQKPNDGSKEE